MNRTDPTLVCAQASRNTHYKILFHQKKIATLKQSRASQELAVFAREEFLRLVGLLINMNESLIYGQRIFYYDWLISKRISRDMENGVILTMLNIYNARGYDLIFIIYAVAILTA